MPNKSSTTAATRRNIPLHTKLLFRLIPAPSVGFLDLILAPMAILLFQIYLDSLDFFFLANISLQISLTKVSILHGLQFEGQQAMIGCITSRSVLSERLSNTPMAESRIFNLHNNDGDTHCLIMAYAFTLFVKFFKSSSHNILFIMLCNIH